MNAWIPKIMVLEKGDSIENSSLLVGIYLKLVSGLNPFEKYSSNWIISPGRIEHNKCLKPPSKFLGCIVLLFILPYIHCCHIRRPSRWFIRLYLQATATAGLLARRVDVTDVLEVDVTTQGFRISFALGCPWKLVTIVSKLVYFTYVGDENNLFI